MTARLTSAPVPPQAPDDHASGEGPLVIAYLDLACPYCAAAWLRLRPGRLRLCFRHFPVASKHPRAPALHAAAEAAAHQGGDAVFFAFVDSLYADQGHVDDPHIWERARGLGLDLARFDADRRSDAIAARIRRDFESGIRAGVARTPAFFADARPISDQDLEGLNP